MSDAAQERDEGSGGALHGAKAVRIILDCPVGLAYGALACALRSLEAGYAHCGYGGPGEPSFFTRKTKTGISALFCPPLNDGGGYGTPSTTDASQALRDQSKPLNPTTREETP